MQYIPDGILWTLTLLRSPHAGDARSRPVFWSAFFAAAAATLYAQAWGPGVNRSCG